MRSNFIPLFLYPLLFVYLISNLVAACFGQAIGTARLPSEMPKTTILIERVRKQTVKDYVALTNLFAVIQNQNGKPVSVPTTNIFALVEREEPAFEPLGSGCLLIYSNIFFIVTAGHVIPPDENVYFRVLKTNKEITTHYSHAQDKGRTGLGWIRSTNADVAITTISLVAEQDDVKCVDLVSLSATYDQVSIGDEVVVVGYPAIIADIQNPDVHIIRHGMVSSKLGNDMILVDAFTFPGNSGGPVFWKPSLGLNFGTGLTFTGPDISGRPPSLLGIVLAYVPYREEAESKQTRRTRIIFEENSGLTSIVSTSKILELFAYPALRSYIEKHAAPKNP